MLGIGGPSRPPPASSYPSRPCARSTDGGPAFRSQSRRGSGDPGRRQLRSDESRTLGDPVGQAPAFRSFLGNGPSGVAWNLRMVTTSVGWAFSEVLPTSPRGSRPGVVRTDDGGVHWAEVVAHSAEPAVAVAADFHDAAQAWVLELLGAESTARFQTVLIASTTDGGINWKRSPRLSVNGQATHIQFVDSLHGWVFAIPSAGGALGSQDTSLYGTTDGGGHWQVVKPASQARSAAGDVGTLPEGCGGPIGPPSFMDANTGWIGAFCDRVFLDVTRDGGLTWKTQPLPAFPGPADPESGPLLYSVDSPQFTTPRDGTPRCNRRSLSAGGGHLLNRRRRGVVGWLPDPAAGAGGRLRRCAERVGHNSHVRRADRPPFALRYCRRWAHLAPRFWPAGLLRSRAEFRHRHHRIHRRAGREGSGRTAVADRRWGSYMGPDPVLRQLRPSRWASDLYESAN